MKLLVGITLSLLGLLAPSQGLVIDHSARLLQRKKQAHNEDKSLTARILQPQNAVAHDELVFRRLLPQNGVIQDQVVFR